jgi:uncharacterized protein (TIRG00374 family)
MGRRGTGLLSGRQLLRLALTLGPLFLGVNLLLPQLAGLEATAERLARASLWLLVLLLLVQASAFLAYGELLRTMLRSAGERPPRQLVQRASIVAVALSKTLPGGSTTALALTIRTLRAHGIDVAHATAALAGSGALSAATLGLLLPVAAAVAILGGQMGGVAMGAVLAAVAVVGAVSLVPLALRAPARLAAAATRAVRWAARGPLRGRVDPEAVGEAVLRGVGSIRALTRDRRALARAVAWALANWLLDAAVLFTLAATFGRGTPLSAVLLAYVIGQLLAAVPITPGGVGVVETVMTGALVAAGASGADATVSVLGWRLLGHWLPIVVGLLVLPTVARGRAGVGGT